MGLMREKDIEKDNFRNKEDMANEMAEEMKCQELLINDDTKSSNEMEFLIDKVCVKIMFFHLMFDHIRSTCSKIFWGYIPLQTNVQMILRMMSLQKICPVLIYAKFSMTFLINWLNLNLNICKNNMSLWYAFFNTSILFCQILGILLSKRRKNE